MSAERVPDAGAWRDAADRGTRLRDGASSGATQDASGVAVAVLPEPLRAELLEWARKGLPDEACGLLAGDGLASDGGRPTRFLPLRNAAASPYRYFIDAQDLYDATMAIEDGGEEVWGIFHSHVASEARPSVTDIGLAAYPDSLYLIASLAGEPHVRAWTIRDGAVTEVELRSEP